MGWYGDWKPYVPVATRRAQGAAYAAKIAKKEKRTLSPVHIEGRKIARSFWGQAWCDNMERYSDYANRLPRGQTYVRNGSVVDLQIERGSVKALVSGSEVYHVTIKIQTLSKPAWNRIKQDSSQSIGSLIDLLQGRFDKGVMERLSHKDGGLFPLPKEIQMRCSCPDSAGLCKHIAAVMYGVGARLDSAPELLFTLRDVDHLELISQAVKRENLDLALSAGDSGALAGSDLSELFGIEIDAGVEAPKKPRGRKKTIATTPQAVAQPPAETKAKPRQKATAKPTTAKKKTVVKKSAAKPVLTAAAKRKSAVQSAKAKRNAK